MHVITVVRNFDMYHGLVKNNINYSQDTSFIFFDNRNENKGISTRYNSFLNSYDYNIEDWFVFCHEDWSLEEDLESKIQSLDKNKIYGPIGMTLEPYYRQSKLVGIITQSNKDGTNKKLIGEKLPDSTEVSTFDCQCLIVHSSLISKYDLRFDENLTFDLYAEDFCIYAREKYNISSNIFYFKCHHFSEGNLTERFKQQLSYLLCKYSNVNKIYYSTVSSAIISSSSLIKKHKLILKISRFFYTCKTTSKGTKIVQIFKIPVCFKKITAQKVNK